MASAVLVLWDGGGNVGPFVVLGQRLLEAGHDVTALVPASLTERFAVAGVPTAERAEQWDPAVQADEVRARPADLAVVDAMLPGALCGAEASGATTVPLVHTLLRANLGGDGDLPHLSMAASAATIGALRDDLGLPPIAQLVDLLWSAPLCLVTTVPELDEGPAVPATVRYVGPLVEGPGADGGWAPPPGEGPLVAVNLGTTDMGEAPVLARVLEGLRSLDVRVVATVGAHLDPADLGPEVSGLVRHTALLPHADAVVTHAGLGSVTAALSHGLPMVCLPLGREQPSNAAAVARLGAGVTLAPDAAPAAIAAAVRAVLEDPARRSAAEAVAAAMRPYGNGTAAVAALADVLEQGPYDPPGA